MCVRVCACVCRRLFFAGSVQMFNCVLAVIALANTLSERIDSLLTLLPCKCSIHNLTHGSATGNLVCANSSALRGTLNYCTRSS